MDLLLQWRYGAAPAMVCHKALALEAGLRREKIWVSITAGSNPQAQGPLSHQVKQSIMFDAFMEEYQNTSVSEKRKSILWQAMTAARAWGEKKAERDHGRGHPHPVQQDNSRTAMGSTREAIETDSNWYVTVFESFVDTYHLVVMLGDSSLGDHFT